DIGKEALNPGIVLVGRGQYRERRIEVRLDGQRRRKEIAVVRGEVDLGRTSLHGADQPIEQFIARPVRRDHRAAGVEREIAVAEGIDAGLDCVARYVWRLLADDVDDSAGPAATVENG